MSLLVPHYTPATCPDHDPQSDRPCECGREADKLARKAKRDKAVVAVTKALARQHVVYQPTSIANVVVITATGLPPVYLSLKSQLDEADYTVYRYRLAATGTWQTMRRDAFFAWLQSPSQSRVTDGFTPVRYMPFGKFKGSLISDLLLEQTSYLRWLSEEATFVSDNLRQTISCLLKQSVSAVVEKT